MQNSLASLVYRRPLGFYRPARPITVQGVLRAQEHTDSVPKASWSAAAKLCSLHASFVC